MTSNLHAYVQVDLARIEHGSVIAFGDEELRRKPKCRYHHLRRVMIKGFCSTKSMVEFTRHILESTPSLKSLTLDTTISCCRRLQTWPVIEKYPASAVLVQQCWQMGTTDIAKAQRAAEAASRYIAGRVPSAVEYTILKPCIHCHE